MQALPLWLDSYCVFDARPVREAGLDPSDVFFRGLAYRVVWFIYWDVARKELAFKQSGGDDSDDPTTWHFAVLKAFNQARPFHKNRLILSGERGVVYEGPGGKVVWAFVDADHHIDSDVPVRELVEGLEFRGPIVPMKARHVYLVPG
jgi:hypothetical protein